MSESVVYIIRATTGGPCKIGYTTNLKRRLESLRNSSSEDLRPVRTTHGTRETERWFHEHFAAKRISREWFEFDPEMLTVIPPAPSPRSDLLDGFFEEHHGLIAKDWKEQFLQALNRAVNRDGHGARRMVTDLGCDKRVAGNYLSGTHQPPMATLLRMMALYPEVADAVIRVVRLAHYERTTKALAALEVAKRELGAELASLGSATEAVP